MQNRLQHLLELRRQPILPTGCPDTMRFEQNVMPTRNDTGDNMRDLLELQCFSAQDATYTRNEPVLGGDLPRPSTRHGSYSHENEFVSSHANIDSSVCASFTSSLHNTHNISDVLLSDVSPQFADDGAGSNTVEHCELREETDVNKFCPGQQNNPQYRSCKANGNSRVLWARESEHIDPNILDRPKTAKILLQSRESCASLPILSPYPQQSHVSLAENGFFEDLPTDDCNETPTPSVSTTTETGVLWAHSSTHVSEIVRPHTSNPYQTTFFCGASPKNANFNDEHSSGEIVWSHDDNLYDLRQDLEIQKIKFAALESKLSLILEFLSQNENWKATKGANAAFSSDLPHTYSVSPRSTDCDPLPSTKTTRSARPSTARHVSKHSESVGYSEHNCTQPIPMDTLPLRARPGFVQSSDQKMKDTEMESFSYLSNDNPSTQVDSVSSGNDFGAEAVYHALLREDQKIPHTSSLLSKGTFIKFYHRCQLPGIVGLTSDRSIRDILSKYTSAGEHNLNYDQFMVLYLQQIRV